ncbi:protein translocase subunit SecD [Acidipila sp. EB88]|uniref:protein translocase subunit SecD n=1 Tax=Acidipila sp. EB88 TaxID=2305226 RepID=UPI000F5D5DE3|nr:protein translocase subunit SecD [Acidipila sp. EB88]RRA48365.1 protein translocase subunit SecD [Acidipila sp. EB88]
MRNRPGTRLLLIIATLLVFVFGIIGIPQGISPAALKASLLRRIHLGLDLSGGTHLILQVMVDEAVGTTTDSDLARMQTDLASAGFEATGNKPDLKQPAVVQLSGIAPDKVQSALTVLGNRYGAQYEFANAGGVITASMKQSAVAELKENTLQQAVDVIRTRVDTLGVSEPTIQEYNVGSNQILVELPGIDDPARVKDVIQSTARLEIHLVNGGPFPTEAAAVQSLGGTLPFDQEMVHAEPGASSAESGDQVYLLKKAPEVAGTDIRDAQSGTNQNTNEAQVTFYLTTAAGNHFADFTQQNKGKGLAIVLDNKIREVANIHDQIRDTGTISGGSMNKTQSDELALLLRTGALPASIHYLQESSVGPSLGADSIRQGVLASVVGMLAVMAFMLIYYRGAGINADLALLLNLIILLGFMGYTHAVLTLPGIAGVILTIGMGVDSNVLIFERIREEMRAGKSASASVDQGFAHAWTTIVDTHVTTIVSAAILFIFGSGPVKGFAITLTFGLFANIFTAVFVSRTIFDANVNRRSRGEAISI